MNGDALGKMLMKQQANCTNCNTSIQFEAGSVLAKKCNINENVLVCSKCFSAFTVLLTPRSLTLEKDVTHRYKEQLERCKQWQSQGLCLYCGGTLGGIIKKCKSCGKKK